ncbi:MAG: DUF4301 family protein [Bacteroides sp.]|jgi:hypothetical protein|nr:DUF4301 family protein [Bacteroides sp.]
MLSEKDHQQLKDKGISPEQLQHQLDQFIKGFPPVRLHRPAIPGDGILRLGEEDVVELVNFFSSSAPEKKVVKFVPASGAATRMFKDLFTWREKLKSGVLPRELMDSDPSAKQFFSDIKSFAFWDDLALIMQRDRVDADHMLATGHYLTLLDYILFEYGLDYAALPKGLLMFHKYGRDARTPLEEHLVEGAEYAQNKNGQVHIHFTVSPEHLKKFQMLVQNTALGYEKKFGVNYEISFSIQKPSTDTVAVNLNNNPFRESNGSLFFRPAGHGALIENLNDLDADVVFIKNIDNVVPDHLKLETFLYKKVIAGVLLKRQQEVFDWLNILEKEIPSRETCQKVLDFAVKHLNLEPGSIPENDEACRKHLIAFLNRPFRVCGMVKNEGEPGGGPFWVTDPETGRNSLQIVESSQINLNDEAQNRIFKASTHFNPVDLVCALKNNKGEKFHLPNFVDPDTGFISQKSKDGMDLKALELPGLWNGAMANWITLFVEVPLITFNPVKTVNDLLRKEHS